MDPIIWDWLLLWRPWPQIILLLVGLGVLYGVGWRRLRERGSRQLATRWRRNVFMAGLVVLGLAMLSPIEVLQELFFSVHMVQHILIMMVGAPLLMVGDPYPFLAWGLPARARPALKALMARDAPFRQLLRRFGTPWICWALYVGSQWVWHIPAAYDAALSSEVLHIAEHMAFFVTALMVWWHVTGAAPRLQGRLGYGQRIGFLLAALASNEALGVSISFAAEPLYSHYLNLPRMWGISVLDDQTLGGALMWVPGGMMYALAAVILLARLLDYQEKQARGAGPAGGAGYEI
jgi:cytochrome c oxidase assembly factor CtaG